MGIEATVGRYIEKSDIIRVLAQEGHRSMLGNRTTADREARIEQYACTLTTYSAKTSHVVKLADEFGPKLELVVHGINEASPRASSKLNYNHESPEQAELGAGGRL